VVVSVVNVAKGPIADSFELDGKSVERITAYLFHVGGNDDPIQLRANADRSFAGSFLLGMGFTFDDTDKDGVASPTSLMRELISKDGRNAEAIFPYYGGEEVNDSPTHEHQRYTINFADMSEDEARKWPDLMQIVEAKVKPERMQLKDNSSSRPRKEKWWLWGRYTPGLFTAINGLSRVLVTSYVGSHTAFAFVPNGGVYAITLAVLAYDRYSPFCVVQSKIHQLWVRFLASSFKDDLRYTPSDCFETFPFPENFETDAKLEAAGKEYYEFRAALMVKNNEGLTKTYNRFHDPNEASADIARLRELHSAMDRAVLDAYGWTDLTPTCEFLLDYDDEEDDEDDAAPARRKKKPWRYRWPDSFRDEVLARLLELNKRRAEEEAAMRAADNKPVKKAARGRGKGKGQLEGKNLF
jgi:hypothetical protein